MTLRARLSLWAALATGLAVLLVAAGLYFAVNGLLQRSLIEQTLTAAGAAQERVEARLRGEGSGGGPLDRLGGPASVSARDLERIADASGPRRGLELRLSDLNSGQSIQTPQFPAGIPLTADLRGGVGQLGDGLIVFRPLRGNALGANAPGNSALGSSALVLTVASDARALGEARRAFTRSLGWLLPLALLLSLGIGWTVAGRLLRPVRDLEGAARAVGEGGDLRRGLPGAGEGDELARLARTLEQSFGRLADARDREQAFLRAAAHDLRSPLAALTARVEGTLARERDPARYRTELREIGTDITRLSTLANHLLLLAREPGALGRAPVNLRELAAEAVDRARELSPEADVDLVAPQPVTVQGDRVLLGQAVWNLTLNALKHAPGAAVTVSVSSQGGGAAVSVHDDGPGVDAATLGRLGEAFFRPDESRHGDGHGLGLALARRAAELHGGVLRLESVPGAGFTATLTLPVQAARAESAARSATLIADEQP